MAGCPACGAQVSPLAKFCSECGAALQVRGVRRAREKPAEGELRQLTALFCDLVGSTELSTRMDAEQFGELIHRYLGRAAEVVRSYEGDVARYLGDGILVHFGWPEAHDDDAERAIRAALDVVAEIEAMNRELPGGTQLAVRIGIHTGPVMIGEIQGSPNQETISLGETLNLAARLQEVAPPNGVALSAATRELVRGIFVIEELGPQTLKGMPAPIEAYRALQPTGVRSRLDAAADRLTPLVGRSQEVATLMDRWQRSREGSGQAVLIIGEAGVGKSRLVHELRSRLREEPHSWLECRCSSYTRQSAFRPAVELIEHGLQLRRSDAPEERLAKLKRGLGIAGVDSGDAVDLLAPLLSLPHDQGSAAEMGMDRRRRLTIEFLVGWLLALAEPQPMVLLAEDLHWSDPSSLELFGELMDRCSGTRLLIVATARPEFAPPWPQESCFHLLRAEPLGGDDAREMVAALSTGEEVPEPVVSRIVTETDGIPLFIEEIGRMALESSELQESGDRPAIPGAEFHIPSSLQASLMARLDRLSAAKHVAQRAAVIGREFSYELLAEVADLDVQALDDGLERLVESDLMFEVGESPNAAYAFKHALIQDAAYQSLLRRTRSVLHGRIAETLERRADGDMGVTPEVVARHFEAAGRFDSAVQHYRLAAAQAARSSGYREAIAHLRHGIELVAQLPAGRARDEEEMEMQIELASSVMTTRGYADPEVQVAYERARALCEALGDGVRVGYALTGLSISRSNQGDVRGGEELAERVLEIAGREADDTLELLARVQLALPACYQGHFAKALEHAQAAIAVYDRDRHRSIAFRFGTDHGVAGHAFAALSLLSLGYPERALAQIGEERKLAKSLGQPFNVAFAIAGAVIVQWMRGDLEALETAADELTAISEEQGFDLFLGMGRMSGAAARALSTGEATSIPDMIEGSAIAARTGTQGGIPALLCLIAEAHRAAGDGTTAAGTVEGALAIADGTGQLAWNPRLLALRGDLHADAGEEGEADDRFRQAITLAHEQGARFEELRATTRLARLMQARGEGREATGLLAAAYERFPEPCAIADLEEARALLDGLRTGLAARYPA